MIRPALIRGGAVLAALCLAMAPAAGQDRPPERPADSLPQPAPAARPVPTEAPMAKPALAEPDMAKPALAEFEGEPDGEPAPVYGPPLPPAWWPLRETDAELAACKAALTAMGTVFRDQPPVTGGDDRDCGIARPIRVEQILPGLVLEGGAVMRCDTAQALGSWARDFLQPAAARLPGAPRVTGLRLGTIHECRARVGTGQETPKLSEHALGNAIDISAVVLSQDEPLVIGPRADTGDLAEAFQRTIRASGCLFFSTVLGPGSNAAHDDHLHLDIASRPGGWRLCQ